MRLKLEPNIEPVPGYRLIEPLGRGGFGEVWKAHGPGGFEVALKFVELAEAVGPVELRALQVIRNIRHPHLLSIFGSWEVDGNLVVAMELAEQTLLDVFRASVQTGLAGIPAPEIFEHFLDAAKGLDYLNESRHNFGGGEPQGIQHRDVKPQNLLLVGGSVKVADFGLARVLAHSQTSHTGSMTPAYAAPEFFDQKTSSQSDQYSLAATYCHLCGGRPPFTGTPMEVMSGHMWRAPDLTMLPEPEQPIVARALAKAPKDRWPSCRYFIEELQSVATTGDRRKPPRSAKIDSGVVPPDTLFSTPGPASPATDRSSSDKPAASPRQADGSTQADFEERFGGSTGTVPAASSDRLEVISFEDVGLKPKPKTASDFIHDFAPAATRPSAPRTSGLATTSLILGFMSVLCLFFTGVPAILLGWQALREIGRSGTAKRGKSLAVSGILLGTFGSLCVPGLLLPAVQAAREAARRSQCVNNLKMIGLAMHNYHAANDCFPPASIADSNGRPMHSWRVALLPFMEQQRLFNAYNYYVPWDSVQNTTVLLNRPAFLACPSDLGSAEETTYEVLVGPDTLFEGPNIVRGIRDTLDGTSNTLMVVETRTPVAWTRPSDLTYSPDKSIEGLGSAHPGGYNALFADGSVRFLKDSLSLETLKKLVTRAGGEVIGSDEY